MQENNCLLINADEGANESGSHEEQSNQGIKSETDVQMQGGNQDNQTDWLLPDQLEKPDETREILWRGHLTQFGLSKLKEFQKDAIQAVELKRDSVIIQPTAKGKSLCYQLPALFEKGSVTVVVCPTISLINSQIENLKSNNIDAVSVGPASGGSPLQSVAAAEKSSLPPILFTTPEYFDKKLKNELVTMKENIKLLVLDEVHKMFDRSSNFRACYDTFKSVKDEFQDTPIMALTATLNDSQLIDLCKNYLRRPVLVRSSVNKRNVKINIEHYDTVRKSSGKDKWKKVAQNIVKTVQSDYAIVYMDFRKDVELLVDSIKEAGIQDVKAYHGSLRSEVKKEIDTAFRSKNFQVLVATESYEVGTHSPHVNLVLRIGCMRNMAVIVQEFGRAGRNNDASDGLLLVKEHVDDQRLIYWTQHCSSEEVELKKKEYEKAWKWIYGLKAGSCLRRCLLENFEDADVIEQSGSGECCCSCDIEEERTFDLKETASLLLKALKELMTIPQVKDVNEDKLISWLRGSKRDWLSAPDIQKYIDSSETYRKAELLGNKSLNKEWWSVHLRQIVHLNLINIQFKVAKGFQFARAYRTYVISDKGEHFLRSPHSIHVLSPFAVESKPTR